MPTQENIDFYQQNAAEVNKLIRTINKPRQVEGFSALTEEEVDLIVTGLRLHIANGGTIEDYQPDIPEPVRKAPPERLPVEQVVLDPNAIHCIFTPCENGYVAKVRDKSYIFQTEKELMRIIKDLFFTSETQPIKKPNAARKPKSTSKAAA